MISKELRIDGIDPRHFANLIRLMDPPEGSDAPGSKRRSSGLLDRITGALDAPAPEVDDEDPLQIAAPVIALLRGQRPVRLFRLGGGTLPLGSLRSGDLEELRRFRKSHGLPFVVALDIDVLPRIWSEVQSVVRLDDDMVCQQLEMLRVLRRALDRQELIVEPRILGVVPIPSYDLLQKTFDRMLPDGRTFVFYLFDRQRIWTSLIAAKQQGDITRLMTHAAIADAVDFKGIRQDAAKVQETVNRRFGKVHIGLFLPLYAWHRLIHGDRSALARAAAARQAVLDPCPPWLMALIGVGAMSEAASRSARLAGRLLSRSGLLPGGAEKLMAQVGNPLDMLGLDPWEAIKLARKWSARILPLFE